MPDPSERPTNTTSLRVIDQAEADRLIRERVNRRARRASRDIPEFRGAHLADMRLHVSSMVMRVNFSHSELERVSFDGSNLNDAAFDRTRLKGCDLSHLNAARLWAEEAVFEECRFTQSYLRRSHFKQARLERCDLTQTELSAIFAVGASFRGSVLDRTTFELAWLDSADFSEAQCT